MTAGVMLVHIKNKRFIESMREFELIHIDLVMIKVTDCLFIFNSISLINPTNLLDKKTFHLYDLNNFYYFIIIFIS